MTSVTRTILLVILGYPYLMALVASSSLLFDKFKRNSLEEKPLFALSTSVTYYAASSRIHCGTLCSRTELAECNPCIEYQYDKDSRTCRLTFSADTDVINEEPFVTSLRRPPPWRNDTCAAVAEPGSSSCAERWIYWAAGDRYYKFRLTPRTQLLASCGGFLSGVVGLFARTPQLISINSAEEQQFIEDTIALCSDLTNDWMTSGNKGLGGWSWSLSAISSYTNWASELDFSIPTDVLYLSFDHDYKWKKDNVLSSYPYICEI